SIGPEPSSTPFDTPSPTTSPVPPTATPAGPTGTPDIVETAAAISTPTADSASPEPVDHTIPISQFRRTIASTDSGVLTDADPSTAWISTGPNPATISIIAELDQPQVVGSVEITAGPEGITGHIVIEISPDGVTWLPIHAELDTGPFAVS